MRVIAGIFLPALCLLALSCNRNSVSLIDTNVKGEVDRQANLHFTFNKSLVPDSMLDRWTQTDYISFEPAIKGAFRWVNTGELEFSPDVKYRPDTRYAVHLNKSLLKHTSYDAIEKTDNLSFYTAPLHLTDVSATWTSPDQSVPHAQVFVTLYFNYKVKPQDLKELLDVQVEGTQVHSQIISTDATYSPVIALQGLRPVDRSFPGKIKINKGLKAVGSLNRTGEPIMAQLDIPSPYIIAVNKVEGTYESGHGQIRVYTSQKLASQDFNNLIAFNDGIKFQASLQDYGILIQSDELKPESSYQFEIQPTLRGEMGSYLRTTYTGNVAFGELQPEIHFTSENSVYLSKKGSGQVEIRVVNVPKVKLTISRIYESNLLEYDNHGYEPAGEGEEDYGYSSSNLGDVIFSKEINTNSLPGDERGRMLSLAPYESVMPDIRGVYHVQVSSTEDYWTRDSKLISFSDIGLIARRGKSHLFVFANSISQSNSLGGVEIRVYGKNNQLVGRAATNADGVADVPLKKELVANARPAMIVAKTADDFTYMPLKSTAVDLSRFDVSGDASASGMDAFIYPERDMYRPGEAMHAGIILRGRNRENPGAIPVTVRLNNPSGQVLNNLRKSTNEQGALELMQPIGSDAITGTYTIEVYSQSDVLLASRNIQVEEFVPDRLKLNVTASKTTIHPGESTAIAIDAQNFIGTPAAGRKYESSTQVKKKSITPKQFSQYNFSLSSSDIPDQAFVQEGTTNEQGQARFNFTVPANYQDMGMLQANFYTTVFDETGRPVTRNTSIDIPTQNAFNGIKSDGSYYRALNQQASYQLVSVNAAGGVVKNAIRVMTILHQYKTVLMREGSYFRYRSVQQDKVLDNRSIAVAGETPYSFIPRVPGDYEIRIMNEGSGAFVAEHFYSYGSWGDSEASFEVNRDGNVDITVDKDEHEKGDKLRLLFKTPFNGRLLVTTEREDLISYQYIDVTNKSAELVMSLDGQAIPNIYVSATLFKAHTLTDMPLTVAHGFRNVNVGDRTHKIDVKIQSADQSRSQTTQDITIAAMPGAMVSLAVVDNGVLQINGFKTPDPYAHFFRRKALGVSPYDMYPLLFPEVRSRKSTGGDMEFANSNRVNPIKAKRFEIMSWWSGLKKAGSDGKVSFKLPVKEFNGEVRIMALAFKDDYYGASEKNMKVIDPLVVSTAMPRFVSPGDTLLVPVTLTNTTQQTGPGQASLVTKGPLKVLGAASQTVSLPAGKESSLVFKMVALADIGVAQIDTKVTGLNAQFNQHIEIAVRPPSTLQKRTGSGVINAGANQSVQIPVNDLIPSSAHYSLSIGKSPLIQQLKSLRYLLEYPYGCTEQTVSTAFPQLYYEDLASLTGGSSKNGMSTASWHVTEAIRKIKLRQLYNGGVTLWDNEGEAQWWTTIYATHFLLEAKKAGFEVDNGMLAKMFGYMNLRLQHRELIDYYYNRDQNRKVVPREVIYSLYVLALGGRTQPALMNYYQSHQDQLTTDSRYLLAASYAAAGDRRSFSTLLPASMGNETSAKETGGSFGSPLRDEALALNTLLDVDPTNSQVIDLSRMVARDLQATDYLNTQEAAFSFTALGKLAKSQQNARVTAKITVNGRTVAQTSDNWKGNESLLKGTGIQILTGGTGLLYYSWEAQGISSTGQFIQEDKFISVRRNYYDRNGKRIAGNNFKQNDLVVVELVLNKQFNQSIQNIVITDLLPAGFEIENPRIREVQGMTWVKNESTPTASDIRDDRINLFVDAYQPTQKYYYLVRVVSPGVFKQGPVSADAMYNGAIHSYHGAGTIRVSSPVVAR